MIVITRRNYRPRVSAQDCLSAGAVRGRSLSCGKVIIYVLSDFNEIILAFEGDGGGLAVVGGGGVCVFVCVVDNI